MPFKKIILGFALLVGVFVLLAYPTSTLASHCLTGANWLCHIAGNAWDAVIESAARLIAGAIIAVPGMIFFVVAGITNYLMVATVNIGISPGTAPAFVTAGWEFSRNFVNMLFLLILVFIGLATILRLREYELQRTLPKLLVMALLVNFSGLLVGFVADVGNIATMVFIRTFSAGFGSEAFSDIFNMTSGHASTFFDSATGLDLVAAFAYSIVLAVVAGFFFIFASLAFLAITLVFFVRLVILWTLVILAPFAFISYILPATRGWWNRWLSTLTQWAFITVPLAFFMMLANMVLNTPSGVTFQTQPNIAGNASFMSDMIGLMLSPTVAIVLLFIGLGLSASMSSSFTRVRKWAGVATAAGAGFLARDLIRDNLAKSERMQRLASRMENFSSNRTGVAGTLLRAGSAPTRWAGRRIGSDAQEKLKTDTTKAETEAKDWSAEKTASMLRGNVSFKKKLGWLNAKVKSGEIDDVVAAGFDEPEIRAIYDQARRTDQHRELQAAFPHFVTNAELQQSRFVRDYNRTHPGARLRPTQITAAQAATINPDQIEEERDRMYRRMKPERTKQMSGGIFARNVAGNLVHGNNLDALVRNFNGARVGNLASSDQGQEAVGPLEERIRGQFQAFQTTTDPAILAAVTAPGMPPPPTNPYDWLAFQPTATQYPTLTAAQRRVIGGNNPALARWMRTQAGQQLGFTL